MVNETNRSRSILSGAGGSRRVVVGALSMIGATFVVYALANHYVMRATEIRTVRLERSSILGVEQLSRLSHELDRERVLIDDHIFETSRKRLLEIEQQLTDATVQLRRAEADYARNPTRPRERARWQAVQASIRRFQDTLSASLELSRLNHTLEARAKILAVRNEYAALEDGLTSLIETNRTNALDSARRIEQIERIADLELWAIRICALLGGSLLAAWTFKRVAFYEKASREYAERLEASNRDLDSFAGRVAHDLKSALGPIALSATVLRQTCSDPNRVLQIAARTERCCRTMGGIVDALLAFSRAGQHVQPDEASVLKEVLASVMDEIAPLTVRIGATIELDGIAEAETRVRCDARLLHIVLANILSNAIKYLEGCDRRRVCVSGAREAGAYRIEVQDTGPGIPNDAHERIFEPFYRVDGARAAGTGIGLATVRRIVDARGGRVAVESNEGQGSRFIVWLPLATTSSSVDGAHPHEPGARLSAGFNARVP